MDLVEEMYVWSFFSSFDSLKLFFLRDYTLPAYTNATDEEERIFRPMPTSTVQVGCHSLGYALFIRWMDIEGLNSLDSVSHEFI